MPLPDDQCRRRLFILYSNGLNMEIKDSNRFIQKTEGASPAFIRELFRRAALCAANDGEELIVKDAHLEEALYELTVQGGELTKSLLGFRTFGFQSGNRPQGGTES
jgi:ATP-dependent 26S proteasome regulatory subunit